MKALIEELKKMDTASISDAMDKLGVPCGLLGIQAVIPGHKICGEAFTVHYVPCGICGAQVEVVKRNELHKFVVLPRRWVVERLFGWLDKFRRLWKNCERKLLISAQILTFALIAILIRRF